MDRSRALCGCWSVPARNDRSSASTLRFAGSHNDRLCEALHGVRHCAWPHPLLEPSCLVLYSAEGRALKAPSRRRSCDMLGTPDNMKTRQRQFVVEIKGGRRLPKAQAASIWGSTDLKALTREVEDRAPHLFSSAEAPHTQVAAESGPTQLPYRSGFWTCQGR